MDRRMRLRSVEVARRDRRRRRRVRSFCIALVRGEEGGEGVDVGSDGEVFGVGVFVVGLDGMVVVVGGGCGSEAMIVGFQDFRGFEGGF